MSKTVGIIGLGSIGERHAVNIIRMGGITVLTHDPKLGNDAEHLCDLIDKSDAIVIASPTHLHADHIHECLLAGKPFFVEKPIKDKLNDREGIEAIMVGYNLRFHACVKKAKEWMNYGTIGDPIWANFTVAQFTDRPEYLRENVILNWSHEIDLALYLLGDAEVKSCIGNAGIADIILMQGNCHTVVHLDYLTEPEIRQTIISGSNSTIILDLVNRQAWLRDADGSILDHLDAEDSWDENYVEEMEAFLARIDGKKTIGCTGEEGLKVLEVCLKAIKLSQ